MRENFEYGEPDCDSWPCPAVSDFNKTNDRYKVELTEYFPYAQKCVQ